jgi:hypothetical protein
MRHVVNSTGVLKVYLVQMKNYVYRLHFMHAVAPEWVLESLKDLNLDIGIGFEEESQNYGNRLPKIIIEEQSKQLDAPDDFNGEEDNEIEVLGGPDQE